MSPVIVASSGTEQEHHEDEKPARKEVTTWKIAKFHFLLDVRFKVNVLLDRYSD